MGNKKWQQPNNNKEQQHQLEQSASETHNKYIGLVLMITPAFKWIPNIFSLPAADTMKYDMVNEFCLASSAWFMPSQK